MLLASCLTVEDYCDKRGTHERSNLATMSVLAQLGVRVGLQYDNICAAAVLKAEGLDVDAAGPMVPAGVFLGVDVGVGGA